MSVAATGHTWTEMKRLWVKGVKAYIEDMWNIVEFATTSVYITAYTLKFVSYFLVCLSTVKARNLAYYGHTMRTQGSWFLPGERDNARNDSRKTIQVVVIFAQQHMETWCLGRER